MVVLLHAWSLLKTVSQWLFAKIQEVEENDVLCYVLAYFYRVYSWFRKNISPHKVLHYLLQAQPVTFPLVAVLSLRIHCDLQEQFTVEAFCKIFIKFNTDCGSISVIFVQNKKQAFTSPDSSKEKSSSSEDISNAISLSSLRNIEPYFLLCAIVIIIFA